MPPCLNIEIVFNLLICFWPGYNTTHFAITMLSILDSKQRINYLTNKLICIDSNGQRNFTVNSKLRVTGLLHLYNCPCVRLMDCEIWSLTHITRLQRKPDTHLIKSNKISQFNPKISCRLSTSFPPSTCAPWTSYTSP